MWDPKNETTAALEDFCARRALDRMELALQDAAREELNRRRDNGTQGGSK